MGHLHGSMPLNLLAIARVAAKQGELATASKLLREALPFAHEIRDDATARQIAELLTQTSQYRKRLAELDEELDDAEAKHDAARHAKRCAERAAVAHVLEISDGKLVRFDQYVDSAALNPIMG